MKRPKSIERDAQDVLDGRRRPSAGDLIELIHAVNPTGRSSSAADERRRYQLKSALQSLLVRTFAEDLVVTKEAGGVIGVRHRYVGLDACHARLDDLEIDARSRVQLLLDLGGDADEVDAPIVPAAPEDDPDVGALALGRAALAEYDYDAARAHFEDAMASTDGGVAAGRALIGLLVEHLADYEGAMAVEEQLSPAALADSQLRAILALAAARIEDTSSALRLLDGLTGERAGDAWVAVAEVFVARRYSAELSRALERLAHCAPGHPALRRLRDEAARLDVEERRPAEDDLLVLVEGGEEAAIEAAARELLRRWPTSAVAGQVLARLQAERRRSEAERFLASAKAAIADGRMDRATELCRKAGALGAETALLASRIGEARAADRLARDEAAVRATCELLAAEDPRRGLEAYLALDPDLRRRAQAASGDRLSSWLETAAAKSPSARPSALVDAVLAIDPASAALDAGDDLAALSILEPHADVVASVSRARELMAAARRNLAARRRISAAAALVEAQAALERGNLDECARSCAVIDRRELEPDVRPALDQVVSRLRARSGIRRRCERVDALVEAGDLVAARTELADAIKSSVAEGQSIERLEARRNDLTAALRSAWHLRADATPRPLDEHDPVGELLGRLPYAESAATWLVADGREIVLATASGPHVFLARVSVDDRRVVARNYLRAPASLGGIISATADGDAFWLFGEAGWVLQLDWRTGEPLRWGSLAPHLRSDETIENAFLLPKSDHVWVDVYQPGQGERGHRVVEVHGWRLRRELPASRYLHPLVSGDSSCVVGTDDDDGAVLYTERGTIAEHVIACAGMRVTTIVRDPTGALVALTTPELDEGSPIDLLRIVGGRAVQRSPLPDSDIDRSHRCAVSRRTGLLFVHHFVDDDESRLVACVGDEDGFRTVYAATAPAHVVLAQDAAGEVIVILWDTSGGIELSELGPEPPAFGRPSDVGGLYALPALADYFTCHPHETEAEARGADVLGAANEAARRGDWPRVCALLEPVAIDSVEPRLLAHLCHLHGLALLRTGGDRSRVRAIWEIGADHDREDSLFTCRLDACLELIEPIPELLPAEWWNTGASIIRQLRVVIAKADALLATGDARGALAVLRRRAVTRTGEIQSHARLASAWLAIDAETSAEQFDKAIALARFAVLAERHKRDLPIPTAWDNAIVAALAARAAEWLAAWPRASPGSNWSSPTFI